MMTTIVRRTSSDLASMSRAAQRKERLLQIEREQRLEEAEALKMTEEQREILLRSFTSVKVEFSDLDGLKWTHSALRRRQGASQPKSPGSPTPPNHAFVILTNADLASFSPEDTIRASAARPRPRFPSLSSPNLSRSSRAGSPANSRSPVKSLFSGSSPKLSARNKDSRRGSDATITPSCHAEGYDSDCDRTVRGGSDVESDLDHEPWSGNAGRGRGKARKMGRRVKRTIQKLMAENDDDDDDDAWEDVKGENESLPRISPPASGLRPSISYSGEVSPRDTSTPSDSTMAPITPSKAPAFITYSSPTLRTMTTSTSAPSLSSPSTSVTQPISSPAITRPSVPSPNAPLLGVPPSINVAPVSTKSPTTSRSTLLPGLPSSQPWTCAEPIPLTRLPHRVRRTPSSSLLSPTSQVSSPPLTSLPFPLTPSSNIPSSKTTSPNLETPITLPRILPPGVPTATLGFSPPPAFSASLALSCEPTSDSIADTLVVRGWSPSSNTNVVHAVETDVCRGSPAGMITHTTLEDTGAENSSL